MRHQGKALHCQMSLALKEFQEHSSQFVYSILLHFTTSSVLSPLSTQYAGSGWILQNRVLCALCVFLVSELLATDNSRVCECCKNNGFYGISNQTCCDCCHNNFLLMFRNKINSSLYLTIGTYNYQVPKKQAENQFSFPPASDFLFSILFHPKCFHTAQPARKPALL